jgi:hypothetical protein
LGLTDCSVLSFPVGDDYELSACQWDMERLYPRLQDSPLLVKALSERVARWLGDATDLFTKLVGPLSTAFGQAIGAENKVRHSAAIQPPLLSSSPSLSRTPCGPRPS